jgi:hypothetical protein
MTLRRCCTWDEGRSLELGVPTSGSNRLKRLWPKATVVSVKEKAAVQSCQIGVKKVSNTEPSLTCREDLNDVKSRNSSSSCDKLKGHWVTDLSGVRHRDGTILTQAQVRNVGNLSPECQGRSSSGAPRKSESTEVGRRDGPTRSSVEVCESRWSKGVGSFQLYSFINRASGRSE